MNIRHVITSALGITVVAAGLPLAAAASPDAATAACTISMSTRIAIGRPSVTVPLRVSGTCSQTNGQACWNFEHPDRKSQQYLTLGVPDSTWTFVDDDTWTGQYVWRPTFALDPAGNKVSQNTLAVTVKLAAGAWISSKRVGDVVTLTGTSLLYSVTTNKYFKRSASGVFQFRERGATTWKTLKSVTTNSSGQVTMTYRYSKTRDYRFALYSTSTSWDLGSAVTTR